MGKKEDIIMPLPLTKAETAEQRLEELANNESVTSYSLVRKQSWNELYVKGGKCRVYPDGFEGVIGPEDAVLHIDRRKVFVYYSLEKEYEKQNGVKNE